MALNIENINKAIKDEFGDESTAVHTYVDGKRIANEREFTEEDWEKVKKLAYFIREHRMAGTKMSKEEAEMEQEKRAREYGLPPDIFKQEKIDEMLEKAKVGKWNPQSQKFMQDWDFATAVSVYENNKYKWEQAEKAAKEQGGKDGKKTLAEKNDEEIERYFGKSERTAVKKERQGASRGRELGSRGSRTGEAPRTPGKETGKETGKEKRRVHIVNIDEIAKGYAWRLAEEKVRELLHRPEENMQSGNSRWRSIWNQVSAPFRHPVEFARKAWVRMAENGYREKFYREALEEITNNQNLMLEIEASARMGTPIRRTSDADDRNRHFEILDKVIQEYSNNAAEQEERGRSVNYPPIDQAFKGLVSRYYQHIQANPGLNASQRRSWFEQEQRNMINGLKSQNLLADVDFLGDTGRSRNETREGRMYATNMFQIAEDYHAHVENKLAEMAKENNLTPEQLQAAREHLVSTIELDINLGAKLSDIHNKKPQGTLTRFEGWIANNIHHCPILGRIANTPGAAAVFGAFAGTFLTRGALRGAAALGLGAAGIATGAWLPILSGALAGGAFGAIRRNLDMKMDRGMDQRQKMLGKEFSDFRRGQMDEYSYDVITTGQLQQRLDEISQAGSYAELNQNHREQLVDMFSRFKFELARDRDYRINGRENRTVDLIAVSREEGEKYGTTLMSKTDLKIKLYKYLKDNNLIGDIHDPLQISNSNNAEFNQLFRERILELDDNVNRADAAFDAHRRRSAALMGVFSGVAAGAAVGAGRYIYENWVDPLISGSRSGEAVTALAVAGHGAKLKPGELSQPFSHGGKNFEVFVSKDGQSIDMAKSHIPAGWRSTPDGKGLILESRGGAVTDFREYARQVGQSTDQRVSYVKFAHQGSPPDPGIRALPETARNLANNLRLHANSTELMMQYKQGADGEVIVDVSKMFGKSIKGPLKEAGIQIQKAMKEGHKFYMALAPSNDPVTQFNPILVKMLPDGTIHIPKNVAKDFFAFDKSGRLLQGSGKHPGLHQFIMDTGQKRADGAMRALGISATIGEEPTLTVPPTRDEIIFVPEKSGGDKWPLIVPVPYPVPRWQLEGERKEGEREKKVVRRGKKKEVSARVAVSGGGGGREILEEDQKKDDRLEPPKAGPLRVAVSKVREAGRKLTRKEMSLSPAGAREEAKEPEKKVDDARKQAKVAVAERLRTEGQQKDYEGMVHTEALINLDLTEDDYKSLMQDTFRVSDNFHLQDVFRKALGGVGKDAAEMTSAYERLIGKLSPENSAGEPQFVQDHQKEQRKILEKFRDRCGNINTPRQSAGVNARSVRPSAPQRIRA